MRGILAVLTAGLLAMSGTAPVQAAEAAPAVRFDPLLALLPVGAPVNTAQADADRAEKGKIRAAQQVSATAAAKTYAEKEPVGKSGLNDAVTTAESLLGFGSSPGRNPKAVITGDLALGNVPKLPQAPEDNGAIPLAADIGTHKIVEIPGVIGDGPHGSTGDGKGDFDFYKVPVAAAGTSLSVDVTAAGGLNAVVIMFTPTGSGFVYMDDPTSGNVTGTVSLPFAGDWHVMVSGWGTLPSDPTDPASGGGVGSEGPYNLRLSSGLDGDRDLYSVDLKAGDVLGATVNGSSRMLSFLDSAGTELQTSSNDFSGSYSVNSPLPGGGNATVDLVAPKTGRYVVAVRSGAGPYEMKLEVYRPETTSVQTLFLDFDGARVNTSIFGAGGAQRDLSPLKAFLAGWGLTAADESKLINAVVATVKENFALSNHVRSSAVRILNSRDHADPFGRPNVSRVVVGGSVAESGISTIGIAQSIDPGNLGHEETALLLLDYVSRPAPDPNSFNTFLAPGADKIAFIGRALGNYVSHEAGHFSGSWHTDQTNATANLMDQGGNPTQMVGAGPDGLGGNADDVDVDFTTDVYIAPFTGIEDTLTRTAWGYSRRGN
ncbi:PPC domain-containing protein [Lentzea sp. NPDC051213]|uniref:PPC domain-containing protein n=1 Tax=Lentzea sp. NPDC051213 TaxID=3364126 RepID=UPI00379B3D56